MSHTRTLHPFRLYGLALLTFLAVASAGWGKVVYVNKNAPGPSQDGTAWVTAFPTVQQGINAASAGDEVWTAVSTPVEPAYRENITLKGGVPIYGGFAGTESARNQRDWRVHQVVLEGSGITAAAIVRSSSQATVLDGFSIRGGYGAYQSEGISVSSGTTTLANCTVTNTTTAINLSGGTAVIAGCIATANTQGIYGFGTATVSNCTLSGNGSGATMSAPTASLTNCTISGNTYSGVNFNTSNLSGKAYVTNCIVAFNGVGISRYGTAITVTVAHSDVYGNSTANYQNYPDPTGSSGNISLDPLLSSPYNAVHLQPGSPCIDAGDDLAFQTGSTDVDGQPRILGPHVDIGSDESDGTTWTTTQHTWYVAPSGRDVNDGTTWATAKQSIGQALAIAQGTDQVWVAAGTYRESVTVPRGVSLYGGFAGTEAARSQRDSAVKNSLITGYGSTVVNAPYPGVILDGFVIQNGQTGVNVSRGLATITNCTIADAATYGIYVDDGGTANVTNCTITGNSSYGIFLYSGAQASVVNCIVAFNVTGVCRYSATSSLYLSHNDAFGNGTNYQGIADPTGSNGNIGLDPILTNAYRDIHIQPTSPCIDAGDDSAVQSWWTDVDGQPRMHFAHVDIGADESDGTGWTVAPKIWYVSPGGSDGNDGTSWAKAKKTIRGGLAVAYGSDDVWVAKGWYAERISLKSGVRLYGGFAGTESDSGQRDIAANRSYISGSGYGTVVTAHNIQQAATIDGFGITGGAGTFIGYGYGVGTFGGGIYCSGSVTISNNIIANNTIASDGCGHCFSWGGGIAAGGGVTIANNLITGNTMGGYRPAGSAVACFGNVSLVNNTIVNNGGNLSSSVYIERGATLVNNIIAYNTYGVSIQGSQSTVALISNDVFGNGSVNYAGITDPTGTNGNIMTDPLFTNRAGGDYHLLPGSPGIDTGNDSAVAPGDRDLDGKPRIIGAHVDMGAYEFGTNFYTVADAAKALRIAAGLEAAPADISRWNVGTPPGVDIVDALHIARMAAGFEPNP